jgi:protein-S-isoprenylcysteine O-methyltransferase Ste14
MGAFATIAYGVMVYLLVLATFLYAIGFVGNVVVPKSVDSGATAPLAEALAVNLLLLGLFAVQHSLMARRGFKRWWLRIVPPPMERSTFVLAASLTLALLFWQWRPITAPLIWSVENPAGKALLHAVFWLGWATVVGSTFLIDHFEFFGLRQASGRPERTPQFRTPGLYRYLRHPIYLGFVLAFWATPTMSAGHLLFAVAMTGYILIGIWFEERDLVAQFGERYCAYRRQVGMLLPRPRGKLEGKLAE